MRNARPMRQLSQQEHRPHPNPVRPVSDRLGYDLGRTPEGEGLFGAAALRFAGLAGAMLGWRPDDFWAATPAELATVFEVLAPRGEAPPGPDDLTRMMEMFPDG